MTQPLFRRQELRRAPGEDVLVPVYSEQVEPTPFGDLLPPERTRQLEASRVHVYGVLLADGRVVASTEAVQLHPFDFCVQLGTSMQLQLLQVGVWSMSSPWCQQRETPVRLPFLHDASVVPFSCFVEVPTVFFLDAWT